MVMKIDIGDLNAIVFEIDFVDLAAMAMKLTLAKSPISISIVTAIKTHCHGC